MSETGQAHEFSREERERITEHDLVFDCPHCNQNLVVDEVAEGHELACPTCNATILVPVRHRVVTLEEAPETRELHAKPEWEQELIAAETALKEAGHQREEAGNFYRQSVSEANRLQGRIERQDPGLPSDADSQLKHHVSEAERHHQRLEKLDQKIKELDSKRTSLRAAHPAA